MQKLIDLECQRAQGYSFTRPAGSADPEIVQGRPAARRTRLRVTDVLSLPAAGSTEDEILEDYPYLAVDDIRACLADAAIQADHPVMDASAGG